MSGYGDENQNPRASRKRTAFGDHNYHNSRDALVAVKRFKQEPLVDPARIASGTFALLPNEVLEQIVVAMDIKTKLNFSLACKRFNRVVSSRIGIKNIVYTCNFDTNNIIVPQRNYQKVKIKRFAGRVTLERDQKILLLFRTKSKHITSVAFSSCTISKFWVSRILSLLPSVHSISFEKCEVTYSSFEAPKLQHLKCFRIEQNVMPIVFDIFRRVDTLEDVQLIPNMRHPYGEPVDNIEDESSADDEEFVTSEENSEYENETDDYDTDMDEPEVHDYREFLARQKNLKTLNISGDEFFQRRLLNCTFQLNELCLSMRLHHDQSIHLLPFLFEQSNINKITMNIRPVDPNSKWNLQRAIAYILRLGTLRKLRLMIYDLTTMQYFKDCQIVNTNISRLYLRLCAMKFFHQRIIEAATNMFPGVERLHLDLESRWFDSELTTPQTFEPLNSMPKLRHLTLEHLDSRFITTLKLKKIKQFVLLNNPDKNPEQTAANLDIFFKNNLRYRKLPTVTSNQHEKNFSHHYVRF